MFVILSSADRSVSDEVTVNQLLPNYTVYQELAAASQLLTTGKPTAATQPVCSGRQGTRLTCGMLSWVFHLG